MIETSINQTTGEPEYRVVHPPTKAPASEHEELRLIIAHLRRDIQTAITFARNSILTNSSDPQSWREDMQVLADNLERQSRV